MVLEELIERLSQHDPKKEVPLGFSTPHSYRGYYDRLAFEPCENTTVGAMLDCAKSALNATYYGWKGGAYTIKAYTEVYIAEIGHCGEELGKILLDYMLGVHS